MSIAQILEIEPVISLEIYDCLSSCVLRKCHELRKKILRTRAQFISAP